MSVSKRIKQGFLRTPLVQKMVLLSSALLMLSPLFPWFDNRNSFNTGETYIGLAGPLFLVGALVMAFGAISFFNLFLPLMGKHFFKMRKKSGMLAMILAVQSLLLIGVANSVFFHPSFGTNVSHKGTRFGLFMAVIAIGFMIGAGYLTHRKEKNGEIEDIEDIMTNEEVEPAPIQAVPQHNVQPVQSSSYPRPLTSHDYNPSPSSTPSTPSSYGQSSDPLLMDPKERFKLMRAQARRAQSQGAQENLWGGQRER